MRIQFPTETSFKGYDARKIKALCIGTTKGGVANELVSIGKNVGFDVFVPTGFGLEKVEECRRRLDLGHKLWLQDLVITTTKNAVIPVFSAELLAHWISETFEKKEELCCSKLSAGGNMFFVQNMETGKEDLLLGADETSNYAKHPEIKSLLGVDKVDVVPQMDFHIDMFLRPLDGKNVLIADDALTIRAMRLGLSRIQSALSKSNVHRDFLKKVYNNLIVELKEFRTAMDRNPYAKLEMTEKSLRKSGYNPIHVPGRIYTIDAQGSMRCTTNYMNSVVTKNDNDEMVYITNKSFFDKKCGITPSIQELIGFSFEDEFLKSISGFVKPENVYFVGGEDSYLENLLHDSFGGLHCITTEIV